MVLRRHPRPAARRPRKPAGMALLAVWIWVCCIKDTRGKGDEPAREPWCGLTHQFARKRALVSLLDRWWGFSAQFGRPGNPYAGKQRPERRAAPTSANLSSLVIDRKSTRLNSSH